MTALPPIQRVAPLGWILEPGEPARQLPLTHCLRAPNDSLRAAKGSLTSPRDDPHRFPLATKGVVMRRQLVYLAILAAAVLTAGASSTLAAGSSGKILYLFNGRLLADAGSSPTLAVDVNGGNRAALRKLVGQDD